MSATVLLVHGAFADGSSWNRVIDRLHREGVAARAIANPLRGLTSDGEYVAGAIAQTDGDVVLVGHSYGGAVATYAGSSAPNVKAFVLVGAFGLDQGESAQSATAEYPDPALLSALQPWTYPGSDIPEVTIQVDRYPDVFGADLPEGEAALGALNQRPVAAQALGEPLAVAPTWRNVPTWWVFGSADHAIHPDFQRETAKKIGATVVELEGGSHAVAQSRADEVTAVILEAVHSL
ncbi:alpha/beta hydrolase [Kineosporia sp. NBRC 101731]|uniref:alpha/beta fold hydrolase n=1 Tax=Kineosporia sp. NBRC 101731 TaxID=3032199 RepID=UPI0024A368CA|nr:alpha/beta hydrolase [Kineosporia sp. NBRC 101731]GLY28843.1 alpha/beta hydrolase [Kineosporia sp. NBRC 101731]